MLFLYNIFLEEIISCTDVYKKKKGFKKNCTLLYKKKKQNIFSCTDLKTQVLVD